MKHTGIQVDNMMCKKRQCLIARNYGIIPKENSNSVSRDIFILSPENKESKARFRRVNVIYLVLIGPVAGWQHFPQGGQVDFYALSIYRGYIKARVSIKEINFCNLNSKFHG